jgi:hypothetical protein
LFSLRHTILGSTSRPASSYDVDAPFMQSWLRGWDIHAFWQAALGGWIPAGVLQGWRDAPPAGQVGEMAAGIYGCGMDARQCLPGTGLRAPGHRAARRRPGAGLVMGR